MRAQGRRLAGLVALGLAFACSIGLAGACSPGSKLATGGTGAGGTPVVTSEDCTALCDHEVAAMCGVIGAACLSDCRMNDLDVGSNPVAACQTEWIAYEDCILAATLSCEATDIAKGPCRGHFDHFTNYCEGIARPTDPCSTLTATEVAAYTPLCAAMPGAPPHPQICRGQVPPGCVVGGSNLNADLYCCP